MARSISILLLFIYCNTVNAQNQITQDSLLAAYNNSTEDTTKIKTLFELSAAFSNHNIIKALSYSKEALELSNELKHTRFIVRAHRQIGTNLIELGNYDEAHKFLIEGLKLASENNLIREQFYSYLNTGALFDRLEKWDDALDYYFKALNIYNLNQSSGEDNLTAFIGILYNNIGNIYSAKEDNKTAEEYYLKGLENAESIGDWNLHGALYNNLGNVKLAQSEYKEALDYLNKSLDIRTRLNEKLGMIRSYNFLSGFYMKTEEYDKAREFARQAFMLSNELHMLKSETDAAYTLFEIYDKLQQVDSALWYHKKYKALSDSLINESTIEKVTKLQLQYEYDKINEAKIAQSEKQKLRQLIITITLTLGIIIMVLLFILSRYRNKRIKMEKIELEKDIDLKNREIANNVMFIVQKNEFINSVSKRLLKLKSKLKSENQQPIQKIIFDLQESVEKEAWGEFEYRFQQVHSAFYNNLYKKYPDLSPAERKLAAFLRLNMTSKDIATITGQSINSIDTARYRLRKKFGIQNQEVNLVSFIMEI